jgi:uncharacterized protein YbjT (DUF2867 family)
MNVLVTGASGRLGRKITNGLRDNGVGVTTLGRKALDSETPNYSWSLGMSPNPQAFEGIDCVLHLAWSTRDRGSKDFHMNVGGSSKVIEASILLGIRTINFSSLSVLNPTSNYGKAKKIIEEINESGLNLRIAKFEESFFVNDHKRAMKILRKLVLIPIPRGLTTQVVEIDQLLKEIVKYTRESSSLGIYTLPYETYEFGEYLRKYHGLRSFYVPKKLVETFFACCKFSQTPQGNLLYDRWVSLISTDQALHK